MTALFKEVPGRPGFNDP